MVNQLKNQIRLLLNFCHLDLTKNLQYDRLTKEIIKSSTTKDSNCVDVGCHKGEILDLFLQYSPEGKHFCFEPIPVYFDELNRKYQNIAVIHPFALSDTEGKTTFNFVRNDPAYSGIKKRKYDVKKPDIEEIEVEVKCLDNVIPPSIKVDLIKIDVEGAELNVLKGASKTLTQNKPVVIFEFGLGASDYYGVKPESLFEFFKGIDFRLSTMKSFLKNKEGLDLDNFVNLYHTNEEYYFVAWPSRE